ncbi:hypothetical protein FOCC_FOCC011350 [Frankliniella occidentalis]|nr:hypothetical protein FOCC_FOCC011350 [Frankliniella occidentalis]
MAARRRGLPGNAKETRSEAGSSKNGDRCKAEGGGPENDEETGSDDCQDRGENDHQEALDDTKSRRHNSRAPKSKKCRVGRKSTAVRPAPAVPHAIAPGTDDKRDTFSASLYSLGGIFSRKENEDHLMRFKRQLLESRQNKQHDITHKNGHDKRHNDQHNTHSDHQNNQNRNNNGNREHNNHNNNHNNNRHNEHDKRNDNHNDHNNQHNHHQHQPNDHNHNHQHDNNHNKSPDYHNNNDKRDNQEDHRRDYSYDDYRDITGDYGAEGSGEGSGGANPDE